MNDTRYAFCVAKIRALENKLLTKQDIASLIDQNSLTSAFAFLLQKGYAKENETANDLIKRQGDNLDELLNESVPDKNELEKLYVLNDYFNIKVLVKCAIENTDAEEFLIYPSAIRYIKTVKKAADGDFSFLKDDYRIIAETAYNIALKSQNGKFSDAVIDKAAIDALSSYAKSKKSGLFGRVCAFLADTANIKTALRCAVTFQDADYINAAIGNCNNLNKAELISVTVNGYDELVSYLETTCYKDGVKIYTEKPSAFEKWCDDQIIEITSKAVYTSFGFAPVVSYFYRKSLEIKTVRMILAAIKSGVDKEKIKERVRELYA